MPFYMCVGMMLSQGVHTVSAELLARLQFGTTIVYHYLFVPITLGLILLVAIMETFYVRSGNTVYRSMSQFWGKLFIINFALGVVTGIVQEFQFAMNWSSYSRFIGDVICAPLAIANLLAFFLEATSPVIWAFGWDACEYDRCHRRKSLWSVQYHGAACEDGGG